MTAKRGPTHVKAYSTSRPMCPARAALPGAHPVIKLSSNETPFGPSPRAVEAFSKLPTRRVTPTARRGACAKRSASFTAPIPTESSAAQAPTSAQPDRAPPISGPAMRRSTASTASSFTRSRSSPAARSRSWRRRPTLPLMSMPFCAVTPATRIVFLANPNNPTGTYLPFDEVKRLRAGLPDDVLLVLDAAYAEYVRANDYEAGIELSPRPRTR